MEPWLSIFVAFFLAFVAAILIVLLAIFPFRKEVFHCLGHRYSRDGKSTAKTSQEMYEF
jgi:hypothetical protein